MYIKRKLESKILKYLDSPEIIAVVGPRQCGKSTMLMKIFEGLEGTSMVSFEDRTALNMFNRNIDDFVDVYVKNRKFLFIDEFQYAKNGGKKLKYIFDTEKTKIFISGSSAIDMTVNALKYLTGRIFIFHLFPFDFEEFLSYKESGYGNILKKKNAEFLALTHPAIGSEEADGTLKRCYEEYALFGGYPRAVLAKDEEEKKEVLKNIYNTYFLREVRDILGLIDDYKLEKLIRSLALQIGNLIEYDELGKISEFSYPTLKKYLNFLEKTFICGLVKPFFKNKRTEIVKNPKVYFFDSGLRNVIVNDFRKFESRGDAGQLLENAVFMQLVKGGYDFNYWRDKKKNEIDFILKLENQKVLAVEIKSSLKTSATTSVLNFKKTHPEIEVVFACSKLKMKADDEMDTKAYPVYAI
ncbi:MAG: ATP-binding protein [Patescibacteria group bacterium]